MNMNDIIMLLLMNENKALVATTRVQKMVFLVEKEAGIVSNDGDFEFIPYRFGPYSFKLAEKIELLANLGLIDWVCALGGM